MTTLRRVSLCLSVAPVLLLATRAEAIPAFARKYQMSCTTCHAPFPRLKPYGEEFAARGFRMPDPSQEPARAVIDTGDPILKLSRDLMLAMRLEGHAAWKEEAAAAADTEWPWVFKILSGGPIAEKWSYYLYFLTEQGEVVGLEDAWLQVTAPMGWPVDLLFGQFQVCDPLFKRELRLMRLDYEIFATHVGDTAVDLTYDRGAVVTWHAPGKVDVVAQVVNGNGIEAADDLGNFDRDTHKNGALRLVRTFGKARVGVFGYLGKERGPGNVQNKTYYLGPDLLVDLAEKWSLSVEYLERRDDDPFFAGGGGPDYETRGGFAELHFLPQGPDGRWALSALYNRVDSDDPDAKVESASITMNRLLARNIRLVIEAGREFRRGKNQLSAGLVAAF